MIHHMQGNLIELAKQGKFDVIVHGCNCFNTMGAGIAVQIAQNFPMAERADQETARGDVNKLGNYTVAEYHDGDHCDLTIINAYTQYGVRSSSNPHPFHYGAFETIMFKLQHEYPRARFGLPYIGMGLAGGNKRVVMQIIENFAKNVTKSGGAVALVEYVG